MRGIKFSMLLLTPFVFGALYLGFILFYLEKDIPIYYFIILIVVILAIFFAKEEIDFWYDKKYPPNLDPAIIGWLNRFFPFFGTLEKDDKEKFEVRLALYLNARAFNLMLKEKENIPEDFKAIIAAHGIRMTLGLDDYLIGDFDRIICYNHPFPTPQKKFLHTVEVHTEDGLILLSIEQLMMGVGQPSKYYNIAYHAYAEALIFLYPKLNNLDDESETWSHLNEILPFTKNSVEKLVGIEDPDFNVVSLSSFFSHTSAYEKNWKAQADHYKEILNYAF